MSLIKTYEKDAIELRSTEKIFTIVLIFLSSEANVPDMKTYTTKLPSRIRAHSYHQSYPMIQCGLIPCDTCPL